MKYNNVIGKLKSLKDPEAVKGMARFGINPKNNFGISVTKLREYAKEIGKVSLEVLNLEGYLIHLEFALQNIVVVMKIRQNTRYFMPLMNL